MSACASPGSKNRNANGSDSTHWRGAGASRLFDGSRPPNEAVGGNPDGRFGPPSSGPKARTSELGRSLEKAPSEPYKNGRFRALA